MSLTRATALAIIALHFAQAAEAAQAVDVSARRVEFRRYDPVTGELAMHLLARSAEMEGEAARMTLVRLIRYEGDDPSVIVQSERGEYRVGGDASLAGGVRVEWTVGIGFMSQDLTWRNEEEALVTDSAVSGWFRGPGDESSLDLEFTGLGLRVDGNARSAEIPRDVAITGRVGEEPFAASADRGVVFRRTGDENLESLLIIMRGPVIMTSSAANVSSDRAGMLFTSNPDGSLVPGGARIEGTVRAAVGSGGEARLPGALLPSLPRGMGDVELRAGLLEVSPGGAVVLYGTLEEPARVIFNRGELRGMRIELSPEGARTDGGAPSEFDL